AAAHAQAVNEPECRTTRAGMHDYLKGRMLPRRQHRLEVHMDSCADCTRAFMDVREVSWMLRDLGQHLVAAMVVTGSAGAAGAAGGVAAGTTRRSPDKKPGPKELAAVAGVLLVLGLGGVAAAMIASQADRPPAEAGQVVDGGAAGGGAGDGAAGDDAAAPPADETDPSDETDTAPEVPPADTPPPAAAPPASGDGAPATGSGAPSTGSAEPAPVDTAPDPVTRPAPEPGDGAPATGGPAPGGDSDAGTDEPPVVAEPEV